MDKPEKTSAQKSVITRSLILANIAKKIRQRKKLNDFVVKKGTTRVLSCTDEKSKQFYQAIKPKSAAELKELIGVPEGFQSPAVKQQMRAKFMSEIMYGKEKKAFSNIFAKTISPKILTSRKTSKNEIFEAKECARLATEYYVYIDSTEVSHLTYLIDWYLELRDATIYVPILEDIIVYDNGTLNIAANTYVVYANKIQLFGSGKIVCDGPTTFECDSFEGFL